MVVGAALVGCASTAVSDVGSTPPPTVGGVGSVPDELTIDPAEVSIPGTIAPRLELLTRAELGPVAESVQGNRVLVIGDSITVSTTERYGGELCSVLSAAGWQTEINAEVGRFIDFGQRVVADRLRPADGLDWDVLVVNLGTNFNGNLDDYQVRLTELVESAGDRQVVLVTVTEFRQDRVGVNAVIVDAMSARPNVRVIDWAGVARTEPAVLQGDRIHLTPFGRSRLVQEISSALGVIDADGQCLGTSVSEIPAADGLDGLEDLDGIEDLDDAETG